MLLTAEPSLRTSDNRSYSLMIGITHKKYFVIQCLMPHNKKDRDRHWKMVSDQERKAMATTNFFT